MSSNIPFPLLKAPPLWRSKLYWHYHTFPHFLLFFRSSLSHSRVLMSSGSFLKSLSSFTSLLFCCSSLVFFVFTVWIDFQNWILKRSFFWTEFSSFSPSFYQMQSTFDHRSVFFFSLHFTKIWSVCFPVLSHSYSSSFMS